MRSADDAGFNTAAPAVLFLDLNSAFASIEQQYRPELRGRPVAVCPGAVRASTVISASREARALGVRTLMRLYEAQRLCPDLVVLEPDAGRYREVSERLLTLLDSYSPRVLPLSIDEAAVDLAGTPSLRRDLRELAGEVKRRLRRRTTSPRASSPRPCPRAAASPSTRCASSAASPRRPTSG